MIRLLAKLRRDNRGVTVVEFAIVVPVMMTLLLGLSDLMYQSYVQSVLDGAVMKAGRDSALEANKADQSAIDTSVRRIVGTLNPGMKWESTRASYSSFAVIKPESFTDKNGNGIRDPGECFTDVNGNGIWDADPSRTGQGGAGDVTRYTMKVTYPRLFPISSLFGWPATQSLTSSTLLKNQPYKGQVVTSTQVCT